MEIEMNGYAKVSKRMNNASAWCFCFDTQNINIAIENTA